VHHSVETIQFVFIYGSMLRVPLDLTAVGSSSHNGHNLMAQRTQGGDEGRSEKATRAGDSNPHTLTNALRIDLRTTPFTILNRRLRKMLTANASRPALVDQITRTWVSKSLSNVLPHGIPSVSALRSSGCRPIARNADKAPSVQLQARRMVNFPKGLIRLRDRQSGDHHVSVEVICRPRRQGEHGY
jgi:hypothetical protein